MSRKWLWVARWRRTFESNYGILFAGKGQSNTKKWPEDNCSYRQHKSAHGRKDLRLGIQKCYQKLLTPDIVSDYPPIINALNRHASILCETSCNEELPRPFHDSFADFIAALEAAEFPSDYLALQTTPLCRAYYTFLMQSEAHIKH